MGIKIGDLNVSKQVKRMYVGVDGKAHRVVKVYAKAKTSSAVTKTGPVYKDEQALQVSARFNLGNMSPTLCSAYISPDTGEFLVSGTFKDKFLLSELSVSKTGMSVQDTGRSISLGSATKPFNAFTNISLAVIGETSSQSLLCSGSVSGRIYMKRIEPCNMSEKGAITNFGFSTTATMLASGPQAMGSYDMKNDWPAPQFVSVNSAGNSGIVAAYSENGGAANTYTFSGYKTSQRSCYTYDDDSIQKKLLITSASTGKDVRILGLSAYFYNNTGAFAKIDTCGSYAVKMPSSYVTTNLYLGAGYSGKAMNSGGTYKYNSYITTVSCQDGSKRYHKLIIDSGSGYSSDTLDFDVKEYTEEHDLPADSSRAAYQKWQVLGCSTYYIYVLSTANDEVKILKFNTTATEIVKVAEYDTGIRLDANTVVQDVIPVTYSSASEKYEKSDENDGDSYIPAFIVTRNNEYNELVIVSRSLIV